jgi:hypothetical protein
MVQKVLAEYFRKKEQRVPTEVAALVIDPVSFAQAQLQTQEIPR